MDVRVVAPGELAAAGASWVRAALAAADRPSPTLMPALGSSALPIYEALAQERGADRLRGSDLRLVQLDEYADLPAGDPRLLRGWLDRAVAIPLGVRAGRVIALRGDDPDPAAACRRYDDAVAAAGGVDVAILGLGPNGHLGFNEPPSAADAPTRRVALTAASLASNARYWPGLTVPAAAVTAGMTTILAARRVLLVVSGRAKRDILREMMSGPIGPAIPASYLRRLESVTLLADRDAWFDEPATAR